MLQASGEGMSENTASFLRGTQISISFLSGHLVNSEGTAVVWLVSSFHLGSLSQLLLCASLQRGRQFTLAVAASC